MIHTKFSSNLFLNLNVMFPKTGVVVCMCNSSAGEVEADGSLGNADHSAHLISELQAPVKILLQSSKHTKNKDR